MGKNIFILTIICSSIMVSQSVFLDFANLDLENGTVEVTYDSPGPIGGFQFGIDGANIIDAYGGAAAEAGFTVSISPTVVLGFSMMGDTLPSGAGIITIVEMEFTGDEICLSGPVITDPAGEMMDVELGACLSLVEPPEPVTLTIENVTNNSFDIYMQNDQAVSGIQIEVDGVIITDAYGGSAEENGFTLSHSETTIVGFSFEGNSIPAGDGLLVTAQFIEATDSDICLTAAVISDENLPPNEFAVEFGDCAELPTNDCGDGLVMDNCGLCYEGVASFENNAPSYGPGELWGFILSTSQSFVTMDAISVFGEDPVSGVSDGSGTGSCPDQNCDIVSLMFNGISVGWSYSILDNEDGTAITLGANLNDFVTQGTENYPMSGDEVYIEFFDASSGTVFTTLNVTTMVANFGYFNVGSITIDDSVYDGCPTEGCMDETACNYDPDALVPGDCDYPEEYYDCDGNCMVDIDCYGECGGTAVEDCTGECGGETLTNNCGECYEGVMEVYSNEPDYGPGSLWGYIQSTAMGFVGIDGIEVFGEPAISGIEDGTSSGACPDQNCDIVSVMYNGLSLGWSYSVIANEIITLPVNLNDFVTPGVENYPGPGPSIVNLEFYDASTGIVYTTLDYEIEVFNFGYTQIGTVTIDESVNDECPDISIFEPEVSLILSSLISDEYVDIEYSISQESGETYLASGSIISDAGQFDFSGLEISDIVGSGTMEFLDTGTDTEFTNLDYQVEVAQILNANEVNVYTRITASNNDEFPVGLVFGAYELENLGEGVRVYAETPGEHQTTNYYNTNLTLSGLFVNPEPGFLTFETELISVAGDVVVENFYFEIEYEYPDPPYNLTAEGGDGQIELNWNYGESAIGSECEGCGDNNGQCIFDCIMQCVSATTVGFWAGDGLCDDGTWGIFLNCDFFECDGGDCTESDGTCGEGLTSYSLKDIHLKEPYNVPESARHGNNQIRNSGRSMVNIQVENCTDNGDGTASYDLYMQSDVDVYGFQFLIDPGDELTGFNGWASGGLAEEAGFSVQLGAANGVILGFSFNGSFIQAQSEPTLLTTIPYNVAGGADACSQPMDLYIAMPGDDVEVWGFTFQFTGHIFSSFACSDGISENTEDCTANGGNWNSFNADYSWTGLNEVPQETTFNVYRDSDLLADNIQNMEYIDSGLSDNEYHCYMVTAVNELGLESDFSEEACAATIDNTIFGCTDENACNYDPDATEEDGSCDYFDCTGECGGGVLTNNCGECYENNTNEGYGYYPDYGPGDVYSTITTTSQGFIGIDGIEVFGESSVGGIDNGSPTGSCPEHNCDVVAVMYEGVTVGWSYSTISNAEITIAVNFNDWVTSGAENYPNPGSYVNIEFYDASSGIIYTTLDYEIQLFPLSFVSIESLIIDDSLNDDCPDLSPDISVDPESLDEELFEGETSTQILTISNDGVSNLEWEIEIVEDRNRLFDYYRNLGNVEIDDINQTTQEPSNTGSLNVRNIYEGEYLHFGISEYGEIMPYQYPIGNEHLANGSHISGYLVAYWYEGTDHIAYNTHEENYNLIPIEYIEEYNGDNITIDVITNTSDGVLEIHRIFEFSTSDKYIRITNNINNISSAEVTDVKWKSFSDWDIDVEHDDDNWGYDSTRTLVYAYNSNYCSIATLTIPNLIDIDGWNNSLADITNRENTYILPPGEYTSFDGLEILEYDFSVIEVGDSRQVITAYISASSLEELQSVNDQAFQGMSGDWLSTNPTSSTIPAGQSVDVTVSFDASYLEDGDYSAEIIITCNDPDESEITIPVNLTVNELTVWGCTDENACNYNPDATDENGSCWYYWDNGWCNCEGDLSDDCGDCGGTCYNPAPIGEEQPEGCQECGCEGLPASGDMMPLEIGNSWYYLHTYNDYYYGNEVDTFNTYLSEIIEYNGNEYYKWSNVDRENIDILNMQTIVGTNLHNRYDERGRDHDDSWEGWRYDQNGDLIYANYYIDEEDSIENFDESIFMINNPYVGANWYSEGFASEIEIIDNVTISTPSGTFNDVWRTSIFPEDDGFNFFMYWKPGVGLIKWEISDSYGYFDITEIFEYNVQSTSNGEVCDCFGNVFDCNEECAGSAGIDDCEICSGGSTGIEPNVSDSTGIVIGPDADCAGECFGAAYTDDCDVCDDDPENDNLLCVGCMDPQAHNYDPDALIDDGSCITGPTILSIYDVPEDNGGEVVINWQKNSMDTIPNNQITEYSVWRYWPNEADNRGWEFLDEISAYGFSDYAYVAPTISTSNFVDSMMVPEYTHYKVLAHTDDQNLFYPSEVDSGYSVDNILPTAPGNFIAQPFDGYNLLTWTIPQGDDISHFDIFRNGAFIATTEDTVYYDYDVRGDDYSYELHAWDQNGNVSEMGSNTSLTSTTLLAGNNLISFRGIPLVSDVQPLLDQLGDVNFIINNGTGLFMNEEGYWSGNLNNIDPVAGYWINVSSDKEWAVSIPGEFTDPCMEYNLIWGNNLISYQGDYNTPTIDALGGSGLADHFLFVVGDGIGLFNDGNDWNGNLHNLTPKKGYWINITSSYPFFQDYENIPFSWNIGAGCPEPSGSLSKEITDPYAHIPDAFRFNQSMEQAFYLIKDLTIDDKELEADDIIIAFNGSKIVGSTTWDGKYTALPVMGRDISIQTEGYCEVGDVPSIKIFKSDLGELVNVTGEVQGWSNLGVHTIESLTGQMVEIPSEFVLHPAYPNPFNPVTTLSFGVPAPSLVEERVSEAGVRSDITLTIFDIKGQKVVDLLNKPMASGHHSIQWNAVGQPSGVYFVKLYAGDFESSQKILLVK